MDRTYTICMIIGIAVPLFTIVMGSVMEFFDGLFDGIDSLLDGLDIDISLDIGDQAIPLIPLSIQSICAGLLLFGTVGKLTYKGENLLFANIVAGISGYVAAMIAQFFIRKLKSVENRPLTKEELTFCRAKVTNTIPAGKFGAISIQTEDGTSLSYPAKASELDASIKQDTPVYILRFEKNVAIVKTASAILEGPELDLYG